jgi:D-arabinose 1-dehydrogenase-like Zn-dependent alcohol dehydrogenase
LCAGLIGWRSLVMDGGAGRLGIYGFGAAGHIVAQIALPGCLFTPSHDPATSRRRVLPAG